MLDDESDDHGSDSGSAGTCGFPFHFRYSIGRVNDSVGRVRGMGSGIFVTIVIKSIGDVVMLVLFIPIVFNSKGGQLIEIIWRPKS